MFFPERKMRHVATFKCTVQFMVKGVLHRCGCVSVDVHWLLNISLFLWEYELQTHLQDTSHLPAVNHARLCRETTSTVAAKCARHDVIRALP